MAGAPRPLALLRVQLARSFSLRRQRIRLQPCHAERGRRGPRRRGCPSLPAADGSQSRQRRLSRLPGGTAAPRGLAQEGERRTTARGSRRPPLSEAASPLGSSARAFS
ncbi:hypothetical protein VULLAG_LOCUS6587 [Vulpes lagopus]